MYAGLYLPRKTCLCTMYVVPVPVHTCMCTYEHTCVPRSTYYYYWTAQLFRPFLSLWFFRFNFALCFNANASSRKYSTGGTKVNCVTLWFPWSTTKYLSSFHVLALLFLLLFVCFVTVKWSMDTGERKVPGPKPRQPHVAMHSMYTYGHTRTNLPNSVLLYIHKSSRSTVAESTGVFGP